MTLNGIEMKSFTLPCTLVMLCYSAVNQKLQIQYVALVECTACIGKMVQSIWVVLTQL